MADDEEREASSGSQRNSYNSLDPPSRLPKAYQQILSLLEESDFPLGPSEIAQKTMLKKSSCRVYLRNLLEKGLIAQMGYGKYVAKTKLQSLKPSSEGRVKVFGGAVPLRIHEVRLRVDGGGVVVRHGEKVVLGDVVYEFVWCGGGVITVRVACDRGLDDKEWRHARDFVLRRLGVGSPEQLEVVSYEIGHDYEGVRLDGAKCLTLKAFDGAIERFYNKRIDGRDVLRHEAKVPKGVSVVSVEALLQGGVTSYNVMQSQFAMQQSIRELAESVKGSNRLSVDQAIKLENIFKGFFERFDRFVGRVQKVDDRMVVVEKSLALFAKALSRKRKYVRRKPKKKTFTARLRKRLKI